MGERLMDADQAEQWVQRVGSFSMILGFVGGLLVGGFAVHLAHVVSDAAADTGDDDGNEK